MQIRDINAGQFIQEIGDVSCLASPRPVFCTGQRFTGAVWGLAGGGGAACAFSGHAKLKAEHNQRKDITGRGDPSMKHPIRLGIK